LIKNEAIAKWEKAIDTQSMKLVMNVYDSNAILLATFSAKEKKGINEIIPYFEGLFKKKNLNVRFITYTTQKIGKTEILSGHYIFSYDGLLNMVHTIKARYTFVTLETKKGIKIINHHSSLQP
tara:strand:- start:14184 stop:14552 length:369 start_codon:yes stop_codon:yes gene_type:complete